jgi:3-methyladenine DNA glycosylase AlkD
MPTKKINTKKVSTNKKTNTKTLKASNLVKDLKELAKIEKTKKKIEADRFYKTKKGEYGEKDVFIGVSVPSIRKQAKKYREMSNKEIEKLLKDKIHEVRMAGLLILVEKYQKAKTKIQKKEIAAFYLKNSQYINSWDLVDLSVYKILGDFLLEEAPKKAYSVLNKLASSKNMWERRMAMVSTYSFIKVGRKEEVKKISKKLLQDGEDLVNKANGWMLREMGKRIGEDELKKFLDENYKVMPKAVLRYAVEKLDKKTKDLYLKAKNRINN